MQHGQAVVRRIAWGALLAAAAGAVQAETVTARFPRQARSEGETFTRMFPDLPPFAAQSDAMRNAMHRMGDPGGLLDAKDVLTDPVQSIVDQPKFSPHNADNPRMTAGITFVGQFLDHDITFDRRSLLTGRSDPARVVNFRTAAFDLDHLYGEGPDRSPELYDPSATDVKFRVDPIPGSPAVSRGGAQRWDVPRDADGDALIGDSRNDENIVVSQFHLAMLRFHNAVTDRLRAQPANAGLSARELFEQARRTVRWHYQWCIVHEFLPLTIGQHRVERLLDRGPRYYRPFADDDERERHDGRPRIPVEFSVAAYRFGHSQVRPSYRVNFGPAGGTPFFAFLFDDARDPQSSDPDDLRGGRRAPRRFVDWQTFFDFGDGNHRSNKLIDTRLSTPLLALPGSLAPLAGLPADGVQSLPSRNLMRHVNFGLPSGQAVARRIDAPVLDARHLRDLEPYGLADSTPLWFYILKEAEVMERGERLGPVGATIVGEVFIGLLKADRGSYLAADPQWKPTLGVVSGPGKFRFVDLLTVAGVVPPLQ